MPKQIRPELKVAASRVSVLDKIGRTLALPHMNKPQRIANPTAERTAVASVFSAKTIGTTATNQKIVAYVVHDPVVPLWVSPNTTTAASTVAFRMGPIQLLSGDNDFMVQPNITSCLSSGTGIGMCLGTDGTSLGLYVPHLTTIFLQHSSALGLTNVRLSGVRHSGTEAVPFTISMSRVGSNNVYEATSSTGGFYFFNEMSFTSDAAAPLNFASLGWTTGNGNSNPMGAPTGTFNANSMVPFNLEPPEFKHSVLPYATTRATAVGVLFQNVSRVLAKEGTARATRIPVESLGSRYGSSVAAVNLWNPDSVTTSDQFVSPIATETYFGPLEKGLYTYTLPDAASTEIRDRVWYLDNVPFPLVHVDAFQYVNVCLFSDLDTNDTTTLAIELDVHLEFRSNSQLFPLGVSLMTLEQWHATTTGCAKLGQFFENPVHLAAIGSLVGAAMRTVAPMVAPYIVKGAQMAGSYILNKAVGKVSSMLQTVPGSQSINKPIAVKKVVVSKKAKAKRKK